jgi:hypothetical protein
MDDTAIRMLQLAHKGYTCSQIVMIMGLELRSEDNPGLVRAMAGLAYGCGSGSGTCGALTGGCCLLALDAAGDSEDPNESGRLVLLLQELTDWFAQRVAGNGQGITCEAIVGPDGPAASRQACGTLVAETFAKVMELLAAENIDPGT